MYTQGKIIQVKIMLATGRLLHSNMFIKTGRHFFSEGKLGIHKTFTVMEHGTYDFFIIRNQK